MQQSPEARIIFFAFPPYESPTKQNAGKSSRPVNHVLVKSRKNKPHPFCYALLHAIQHKGGLIFGVKVNQYGVFSLYF